MLRHLPSTVAASALTLASVCRTTGPHWTPALVAATGYAPNHLSPCVSDLHAIFRRAASSNLRSVHEKYLASDRLAVAETTPPDVLPPLLPDPDASS